MIGLVDGNNFYVSCERIFDLSLAGKPVAVLSNNDGCVISRSDEFKALDIPMGTPFFQLKPRLSKDGIIIRSSNYELYGDISRRVVAVLREFAPEVEPYSIDEAFIRLNPAENPDFAARGQAIRRAVLQWVGIPCGVGFAPTRTLAKIANHIGKKSASGVYVMPSDPRPVLERLAVAEVWGVGRRLAPQLERCGIRTAWELAAADETVIRRRFNVTLAKTVLELRGIEAFEREDPEAPAQSISCSRSFGHPVVEFGDLREAVAYYTARAAGKLRTEERLAAGANVYFQYYPEYAPDPLPGGFAETGVMFDTPTADPAAMLRVLGPKLRPMFAPGRRYKKAGVIFFGLEPAVNRQPDLFADAAADDRSARLCAVVDAINRRFGRDTVFNLSEGIRKPWAMKRDKLTPRYTTCWDQIPTVG